MTKSPTATRRAPRISRAEWIARRIEKDIVGRALAPGTHLGTKAELRERFAVSPSTISEALRILDTRRITDARPGPGGGVFVSPPSARAHVSQMVLGFDADESTYRECLVVRNALEPLICRDAARACRPEDAEVLRSIVELMAAAVDEPARYLELNWRLHRKLASLSDNTTLKDLYLTLLDYVEGGLRDVRFDGSTDAAENLGVHRELVEAIISGSQTDLEAAIKAHTPLVNRSRPDEPGR